MSDVATFLARRALADIEANGGILRRQHDQNDGLPRALVEFAPGADRARCRALVAEAKADGIWPAIVRSLPVNAEASR